MLASTSPRRRELIKALDVEVELVSPGSDEGRPYPKETGREYVRRISLEKARKAAEPPRAGAALVLGADTSVVLDGEIFGKPTDEADAVRMLRKLRGRTHTVVTGVTLLDSSTGAWLSGDKATEVTLRCYSDEEIAAYVASGEPMDKAGAYAVQDRQFNPSERETGCYLNAIGFPLCEVVELLRRAGVQARVRQDWQFPEECEGCPLKLAQEASR